MTIKIKAPRAYLSSGLFVTPHSAGKHSKPVRIVREADWRRLMKLVKEADLYIQGVEREKQHMPLPLIHALDALKGAK